MPGYIIQSENTSLPDYYFDETREKGVIVF